jgi:hypothetical protein
MAATNVARPGIAATLPLAAGQVEQRDFVPRGALGCPPMFLARFTAARVSRALRSKPLPGIRIWRWPEFAYFWRRRTKPVPALVRPRGACGENPFPNVLGDAVAHEPLAPDEW